MGTRTTGILLVVVALAAVIIVILFAQGLSDAIIEDPEPTADPADQAGVGDADACEFTVGGEEPVVVYSLPASAEAHQLDTLGAGERRPVVAQSGRYYAVQVASEGQEGRRGWVEAAAGSATGEACATLPVDETPLGDYEGVCAFSPLADLTLYGESALATELGQLEPGGYLVLERTGEAVRVLAEPGVEGWVAADAALLHGACTDIPEAASDSPETLGTDAE